MNYKCDTARANDYVFELLPSKVLMKESVVRPKVIFKAKTVKEVLDQIELHYPLTYAAWGPCYTVTPSDNTETYRIRSPACSCCPWMQSISLHMRAI